MKSVTYVRDAVRPGGTPSRYLIWVEVVLLSQVLASVLPSPLFWEEGFGAAEYVLIGTGAIIFLSNLARTDQQKIMVSYALYIVGLVVSTVTISMGITSLSGIVFMLTWAMTLFVSERREYISFDLVTVFMVLMLISSVILLTFNPKMGVAENWIVLYTGGFLTAVDIYLVYIDFGSSRNFYQESRKSFTNLEKLSARLSKILSQQDELNTLLWQVAEECVPFLQLEECVIYLYDEEDGVLKQVAAYGAKSTNEQSIVDPITIHPGKGIVGRAFATGEMVMVEETTLEKDYIVDDALRRSELAMPIFSEGKTIGVVDSEHTQSGYFKERHVQAFSIMAAFCGIKITEYNAQEAMQQAESAKNEALRSKEMDQLKSRFVTNISHDLKTPLSLIKAPAMQIESIAEDERIQKHAKYILKNTEHLLRVVSQLLQLNRVEKGLNELYLEEVSMEALIKKIGTQYKGLSEKDGIDFEYHSEPAILYTDAFRIEQIIHNLVHNAFRYTGKRGAVSLRAFPKDDVFSIIISDNGPGISQELQGRIFDRFFKADENNHEGTGIGLSLVKEYVLSLEGTVNLQSEEGKGTTFTVNVPIKQLEGTTVETALELNESEGSKPLMLVVEDHADLNDFICNFFADSYLCKSAFDGAEALKIMEEQLPDVVVSDLMMPEMDGGEFVKTIKTDERFEHIPVVILSAKAQVESRIDLYATGADNYVTKPFDINELQAIVDGLIEQRRKLNKRLHSALETIKDTEVVPQEQEPVSQEENSFIKAASSYVLEHLDKSELQVPDVASALGYGRNKFLKLMKEYTELSPVEFIRAVRLSEAKRILEEENLTISETAYKVGFNNLSYFTRSFKNAFGLLPSEVVKV